MSGADRKASILVVDDHEDTVEMVALLLQEEGFEVLTARTGREAVTKALEARPFLILMDLGLPDRSGIEICEALRAAVPASRIVAVTGYPLPSIREALTRSGFHDAVQKPVTVASFRKLVLDAGARGT
ncbi:MAG: response regulator [Deltaproteobacteria bacterium]|nr:response regulator [Deltaproteobacteria bacterium]